MSSMIPIIQIDPNESHKLDVTIALRKLYYHPSGYHRTSKKLHKACQLAGHNFTLSEVHNWLERQALHQMHKSRPKYIPYASFISITVPNEVHMSDTTPMPHDKYKGHIFKYRFVVKDVASRYRRSLALTSKMAINTAEAFKILYNDPDCPLTWPKLLIIDMGTEYMGACKRILLVHDVKIQYANSKRSVSIAERDHLISENHLFKIQDAVEIRLPPGEQCRIWVKYQYIEDEKFNNSVTRLIGMAPSKAIKQKNVYAKSSCTYDRPIGFEESRLTYGDTVHYLLEHGELEGGPKRRGTDMNWSSDVYHISEALIQKKQPVLYKLSNGPKRRFVREELMVVKNVELPPEWVLSH